MPTDAFQFSNYTVDTFNDDNMAVLALNKGLVQAPFVMLREPRVPCLHDRYGSGSRECSIQRDVARKAAPKGSSTLVTKVKSATQAHLINAELWDPPPLPMLYGFRPRPEGLNDKPCNNFCYFTIGAVL